MLEENIIVYCYLGVDLEEDINDITILYALSALLSGYIAAGLIKFMIFRVEMKFVLVFNEEIL